MFRQAVARGDTETHSRIIWQRGYPEMDEGEGEGEGTAVDDEGGGGMLSV